MLQLQNDRCRFAIGNQMMQLNRLVVLFSEFKLELNSFNDTPNHDISELHI